MVTSRVVLADHLKELNSFGVSSEVASSILTAYDKRIGHLNSQKPIDEKTIRALAGTKVKATVRVGPELEDVETWTGDLALQIITQKMPGSRRPLREVWFRVYVYVTDYGGSEYIYTKENVLINLLAVTPL